MQPGRSSVAASGEIRFYRLLQRYEDVHARLAGLSGSPAPLPRALLTLELWRLRVSLTVLARRFTAARGGREGVLSPSDAEAGRPLFLARPGLHRGDLR